MSIAGDRLQRLTDTLPAWRKEEAMRFKFEGGKRECTLSYIMLCDILREVFGINDMPTFTKGVHGKPALSLKSKDGKELFFNMSHCKHAIACIVSDEGEVGIDVECTGRYKTALAEYCMNEEELNMIQGAEDADSMFTLLWTKKEALLKYTGEGITDDMKNCLYSHRMQGVCIHSECWKEKGYAFSVAQKE